MNHMGQYKIEKNILFLNNKEINITDIHNIVRGNDYYDETPFVAIQWNTYGPSTTPARFKTSEEAENFEKQLLNVCQKFGTWEEIEVAPWEISGHKKTIRRPESTKS